MHEKLVQIEYNYIYVDFASSHFHMSLQADLTGMMGDGNGKIPQVAMAAVLAADTISVFHPLCLLGPLRMHDLFPHGLEGVRLILLVNHIIF